MIKHILSFVAIFTTTILLAQRNNSSPYSFFGIGTTYKAQTVEQASMGGIGVAQRNFNYLNFYNPADNANLRVATYTFGGKVSYVTIQDNNEKQSGSVTNLEYISLGFPIGKRAGFSFGLQPYSTVGYSIIDKQSLEGVQENTKYEGSGGSNRLYAAFGYQISKKLSVGIEGNYIFGNVNATILNGREDVALLTKSVRSGKVNGFKLRFGSNYQTVLKDDLFINFGFALQIENNITISGDQKVYTLTVDTNNRELIRDINTDENIAGKLNEPTKTNIGIGIGKEGKWYTGVNYEFGTPIKKQGNFFTAGKSYTYGNTSKLSVGGFYIPKFNSISSYFDRITYRAGVRYEKTGMMVAATQSNNNFTPINDFGINLGLGLPMGNRLSNLNFGIEYGQRGTTANNLIKESYFNFRLSLSLNDTGWFAKRKID